MSVRERRKMSEGEVKGKKKKTKTSQGGTRWPDAVSKYPATKSAQPSKDAFEMYQTATSASSFRLRLFRRKSDNNGFPHSV